MDMQAHAGQVVPNWSDHKNKVFKGEAEIKYGQPVKLEPGDPKEQFFNNQNIYYTPIISLTYVKN